MEVTINGVKKEISNCENNQRKSVSENTITGSCFRVYL